MSETERYIGKTVDELLLKDANLQMLDKFSQFVSKKGRWSIETFGETDEGRGPNAQTICNHIQKEVSEVLDDPVDLLEWIDLILLAMDGYYRYGGTECGRDLWRKHQINLSRKWPDKQDREPGSCTEHIR